LPLTAAALFMAWAYGGSHSWVAGSNPAGSMDVCLL